MYLREERRNIFAGFGLLFCRNAILLSLCLSFMRGIVFFQQQLTDIIQNRYLYGLLNLYDPALLLVRK